MPDGYETQILPPRERQFAGAARRKREGRPTVGQVGLSVQRSSRTCTSRYGTKARWSTLRAQPYLEWLPDRHCRNRRIVGGAGSCSTRIPSGLSALSAGFADGPVTQDSVEAEATHAPEPSLSCAGLFVHVIGLDAGDVQELTLVGRTAALSPRVAPRRLCGPGPSPCYSRAASARLGLTPGTYTATFRPCCVLARQRSSGTSIQPCR